MGSVFLIVIHTKNQVKDLFRLNKELQEENYYMAEFEFKMLGISYLLDKGHYYTSLKKLDELHSQMKTREGLIKMSDFKTKEEEMEFYLSLQNPKTGAFMDDSYPLSVQHEPTANVLLHLDNLAQETNQPLKLKYPLKYLDYINTTEKLIPILEDWSTVGWLALKFQQTSFHNVRDISSLARDRNIYGEDAGSIIQKHNLYNFSQEWKDSMLQWFYDYQDPETGTWGPKSKGGKLLKKDLSNTAPILKNFVDENGTNIHAKFPLRYQNELTNTILGESYFEHLPKDDELDEWHEWSLNTPKSIRTITRYLWKNITQENKEKTRDLIEDYVKIKFEKFYVTKEGAFSYYPNSDHATLDGTGSMINNLNDFGFLSAANQERLWGDNQNSIIDLGTHQVSDISDEDFNVLTDNKINSFRVYTRNPDYDDLNSNVHAVFYHNETKILDAVDLILKINKWVNTTNQTMGNWVSKEEIIKELDKINIEEVPVYENIPLDSLNKDLYENKQIVIMGFTTLQVPIYKITFKFEKWNSPAVSTIAD